MSEYAWKSIRFPKDLSNKISHQAKEEKRSFSSQVLFYVERELNKNDEEKKAQ